MGTLAWVGVLLFLLGGLALLVAAFRVSVWWGLFCFLLPPVPFLFMLVHWDKAWRPLLLQLLGIVLMVVALVRSTGFNYTQYQQLVAQYSQMMQALSAMDPASREPVREYSPDDPTIIGNVPLDEPSAALAAPAPDVNKPDTIYTCTDAQGHITFTPIPCEGERVPCEGQGCGE